MSCMLYCFHGSVWRPDLEAISILSYDHFHFIFLNFHFFVGTRTRACQHCLDSRAFSNNQWFPAVHLVNLLSILIPKVVYKLQHTNILRNVSSKRKEPEYKIYISTWLWLYFLAASITWTAPPPQCTPKDENDIRIVNISLLNGSTQEALKWSYTLPAGSYARTTIFRINKGASQILERYFTIMVVTLTIYGA